MPYNILIFSIRKSSLSSAEFKDWYESHVRLLKFYIGGLSQSDIGDTTYIRGIITILLFFERIKPFSIHAVAGGKL
jgi:hypothetical protein